MSNQTLEYKMIVHLFGRAFSSRCASFGLPEYGLHVEFIKVSLAVACRMKNTLRSQQVMANLPRERLIPGKPPFSYVGIDFFDPMDVTNGKFSKTSRMSSHVYLWEQPTCKGQIS